MIRKFKMTLSLLLVGVFAILFAPLSKAQFNTLTYYQYSIFEYTELNVDDIQKSLWDIYNEFSDSFKAVTHSEAVSLLKQKLEERGIGTTILKNGENFVRESEALSIGILQEINWFAYCAPGKKTLNEIKYAIYMFAEEFKSKTVSNNGKYISLWYDPEPFPGAAYLISQDEKEKITVQENLDYFSKLSGSDIF